MEALELKKKAAVLRKNLIELIYKGGTGHTWKIAIVSF